MTKMNWTALRNAIGEAAHIVLLPHIYADGDALGSSGALALFLQAQGKQVTIVIEEAVQDKLSFLCTKAGITFALPETEIARADLAIAVDVSDYARLGSRKGFFDSARMQARIDHHGVSGDFASITVCNPEWAATAEGIYEFLTEMHAVWTVPMAICLYTGLVTDTGCFAYSNVRPETMKAGSAMLEIAGDLSWIYRETFENKTKSCIALTAIAYAKTEYEAGGSIAFLQLDAQDYDSAGATDEDSEGFSAMLRAIQGVHVSIFVRDGRNPGQYRVSLRSDEACDVAKVAAEFGGGGHARAAGITFTIDKEENFTQFKTRLITRLKECMEA